MGTPSSGSAATRSTRVCTIFPSQAPKIDPIPALDSEGLAKIKAREAQKSAEKAAKEKERKAELAKQEAELAEKWRNGEVNQTPWNTPVMLRLTPDKSEVETSKGARIPVLHAIRGLKFVREVVKRGEAFQTNGHKFPLGVYQVDRIERDGTLRAGCHVISYAEIERIAPQLESIAASTPITAIQSLHARVSSVCGLTRK